MKNTNDLNTLYRLLGTAEDSIKSAKQLLKSLNGDDLDEINQHVLKETQDKKGKIIEGIFDGENLIGPGGKKFPVPANYASKSKLVEGDILKLNIDSDGQFVFKQIGPIERKTLVGELVTDNGNFGVMANDKFYKVLLAAVTYFKAQPSDRVTIIVPKKQTSQWAAIENVIK